MNPAHIVLKVDGERVPMNAFVQRIFIHTIEGMLRALEGIKANPKDIHISIKKEGKG
jgi:hypothetical protein